MIGTNLKRIRQKKRMTQQQLAEQLGVSRQAICLWEADKREIRASVLPKIADTLKVNINELVRVIEKDMRNAHFEIVDADAKEVYVAGNFTNWKKKVKLRRLSNGTWRKKIDLKSGRYEYKFIVDGEWRIDPNNEQTAYNSVGTLNSIKEL